MRFRTSLILGIAIVMLLAPHAAHANIINVNTGITTTVSGVVRGIVNIILLLSGVIATGLFLLGAMIMVGSTGNDQYVTIGKRLMKASLIGFSIVLSSWMMVSTVITLLY